jgi:hypothetical protein
MSVDFCRIGQQAQKPGLASTIIGATVIMSVPPQPTRKAFAQLCMNIDTDQTQNVVPSSNP